jgi:HD-like signal output (HDOD) protein
MNSDHQNNQAKLLERMKSLLPIADLSAEVHRNLIQQAKLSSFPKGQHFLIPADSDREYVYLLDGSVLIKESEESGTKIHAGDINARMPMCEGNTESLRILALEKTTILHFHRNLYDVLTGDMSDNSFDVEETNDSTDELFFQIYNAFITGQLKVPSLPGIALRVRKAVNHPDANAADVSRLVQADPAMVGRLIQAANSAVFKGEDSIKDCLTAVMRMGLNTTRDLVTGFALKNLFKGSNLAMKEHMKDLWRHSTQVAALCSVLCKQVKGLNADRALLAGLIHDVGSLSILAYCDTREEIDLNQIDLALVIRRLGGQVGAIIMNRWDLGAEFVEVTLEAENWTRTHEGSVDYADIVIAAQLILKARQNTKSANLNLVQLDVLAKIPNAETIDFGLNIMRDARNDIDDLMRLLGSYA